MRRRPTEERTIDRVLRWAADLGWNQNDFAKHMGVSAGRLTNWKRRGMPARECPKAAAILNHTLEELLGIESEKPRATPSPAELVAAWPFRFARERFDRLEPDQKASIENAVLTLIGAYESAGGAAPSKRSAS